MTPRYMSRKQVAEYIGPGAWAGKDGDMTEKRTVQQERIANGLCPRCGEEAAPYRLCYKHRFEAKLVRGLKRMASVNSITVQKIGGKLYYSPGSRPDAYKALRWSEPKSEADGRYRPRIGRVPVDVEKTIIRIIEQTGRPCTFEEIMAA